MTKFFKPMLAADSVLFYDQAKPPVKITHADLESALQVSSQMLADGLSVPVIDEHTAPGDKDGIPRRDREAAAVRNGSGWVEKYAIRADNVGRKWLGAVVDITSPTMADKIRRGEVKFVSPDLGVYRDGETGKEYRGAVRHVALTHKPIVKSQGPFEEIKPEPFSTVVGMAASLGLSLCLSHSNSVQFADDGEEDDPKKKKFPPAADDGADDSADAADDSSATAANADPEAMPADPQFPDDDNEEEERIEDPSNEEEEIANLILDLGDIGIQLPEDTKPDTFLQNVKAAVSVIKGLQQQNGEGADPAGSQLTEEKPMSRQFSLKDQPEPLQKAIQLSIRHASNSAKTSLGLRLEKQIERLGPILDDKHREELTAAVNGMQLSLNADGTDFETHPAESLIANLERLKTPAKWDDVLSSQYSAVAQPEFAQPKTESKADADARLKKMGKEQAGVRQAS